MTEKKRIKKLENIIVKMWLSKKPLKHTKLQYAEEPTCNWESWHHGFCIEAAKIVKARAKS
jgi:hypothetical protein